MDTPAERGREVCSTRAPQRQATSCPAGIGRGDEHEVLAPRGGRRPSLDRLDLETTPGGNGDRTVERLRAVVHGGGDRTQGGVRVRRAEVQARFRGRGCRIRHGERDRVAGRTARNRVQNEEPPNRRNLFHRSPIGIRRCC